MKSRSHIATHLAQQHHSIQLWMRKSDVIIVLLDIVLNVNQVISASYHLLVRVATDLLGELRALPPSSRPLGDPPEHDEFPSSPDPELELLLLLVYIREES